MTPLIILPSRLLDLAPSPSLAALGRALAGQSPRSGPPVLIELSAASTSRPAAAKVAPTLADLRRRRGELQP